MDNHFKELDAQSLDRDTALSFPKSMFRIGEFFARVQEAFQPFGHKTLTNRLESKGGIPFDEVGWFKQGVDCEILRPDSKGWQKGKIRIRISLEFCPDDIGEASNIPSLANTEQVASLDDIRQTLNHSNS